MVGKIYAPNVSVPLQGLAFGGEGDDARPVSYDDPFPVAAAGLSRSFRAQATLARPADTTAYAAGDLIANSTTAASVVPLEFTAGRFDGSDLANGAVLIQSARIIAGVGAPTIRPRLRLYGAAPFAANGYPADNAALTGASGALTVDALRFEQIVGDVSAWTQAASGVAFADIVLANPLPMVTDAAGKLFGLLEALNAATPTSQLQYTVVLRGLH